METQVVIWPDVTRMLLCGWRLAWDLPWPPDRVVMRRTALAQEGGA